MKKGVKIVLIILVVVIILGLTFFAIDYSRVKKGEKPIFCIHSPAGVYRDGGTIEYWGLGYKVIDFNRFDGYDDMKIGSYFMKYEDFEDDMIATLKAVVVKADENNILAMGIENGTELYTIGPTDNELKKGQEILIYFDGNIMESYPAQLGNIKKIEIIKDKSEIPIPDDILRFCYNSKDNVTISISELSNSGITLNIKDTNELPYNYSHSYIINKKVKNENYTGVGEQIGENTGNSIAGYTRNRDGVYMERIR